MVKSQEKVIVVNVRSLNPLHFCSHVCLGLEAQQKPQAILTFFTLLPNSKVGMMMSLSTVRFFNLGP